MKFVKEKGTKSILERFLSTIEDLLNKYFYKRPFPGGKCEIWYCNNPAEYTIKEEYYPYVSFKHYCREHAIAVANKLSKLGV